jgi:AI-2 transport protein TqsA
MLVMTLLITLQGLIGNVLEPKALGNSIGLHPVTVLLSLTFWGLIWGIPGMFLSIPITSTLKIVFDEFEFTAPIGRLLEGEFN